ncbi:MAG: hypothetical protein ACYDGR_16290 [Candidatus Dormibacteria bacterium]
MCTFEDDRTVQVCDIAIGSVRAELDGKFTGSLTYVHRDGEPTRVVAGAGVPAAEFRSSAERAIARAQLADLG